jgi:PAS domain S-box-containing protein
MEKTYKGADQLIIANIELAFLSKEKEKRAAELIVANIELAFQNGEKEKRGAELLVANIELAFQNEEKEKRATELIVANIELAFQNEEKEKLGAELILAKRELVFQNIEKEKRVAELIRANIEQVFQNKEKVKRAAELFIANRERVFQNEEKEKRAAELIVANKELAFQNEEKEKRATELYLAKRELVFQNNEKEKLVAELKFFTTVDVIQRKKDEEHIGRLASIVESTEDAVISKSLEGIIKSWNTGSEKMFGYSEKQAIGKHISLIIPQDHINEEKEIIERIRNNETIDHYETVRRKKSGERFHVSLTVSPVKDRAGNIIGVSKIARDITIRKKSEAELIHLNQELTFQNDEREKRAAELIVDNNQLSFQMEEKDKRIIELITANEGLKQFAYVASHDLREPLRAVSNYMQVFEEDYLERLDDNARKYLYSVNSATKKMSNLIKSLLGFSRLGNNKKLTQVDCKELVDVVISDLEGMIKTYSAVIKVSKMPKLNAYETEIRQVFQHLIINAIKFHKKDTSPKIKIWSEKLDEKWRFSISDEGVGIAPAHFESVFDIFQRLNAEDEHEGNGIGLANCKKIVQLHQGEIWVESSPTQTTFHFTISNLTV